MEEFTKNMSEILEIDLALEDYEDDTGLEYNDEEKKMFDDLKLLRSEKDSLSEKELTTRSSEILFRLNQLLDKIGRDKFVFYENGNVNYIWKYKKGDSNGKKMGIYK